MLNVGFKGQSHIFGLSIFSTQKINKTEKNFLGISGSSLLFLIDVVNSFIEKCIHNTFQIHGDKTQRQKKNKVKFIDFNRMKLVVLPYSESYFENKIHFGKILPIFL